MDDADDMNPVIDEICAIDPSYRADLRGADDAAIARLEAASGRPLPAIYRSFLRTMGEEWGIPFPKADLRPARLIDYFETMPWRPPPGFTMIGDDNTGNSEDYFLDARSSPPSVVLFPKCTDPTEPDADLSYYDWLAPSLPHFVFQMFFLLRHLEKNHIQASKCLPGNWGYVGEGGYAMANELLLRMGFASHPRSGHGYHFYIKPEISVVVSRPEENICVYLGGPNVNEVERVFSILNDHIGLFRCSSRTRS